MTLDEFSNMTKRIIADNGFEEYVPTAIYPARRHIQTFMGLPPDLEMERAVLKWAAEDAQNDEEFLVAFKVDESHFKVIRRIGPYSEYETYGID